MAVFIINFAVLSCLALFIFFSHKDRSENKGFTYVALGVSFVSLTRYFAELCETVNAIYFWTQVSWVIIFFLPLVFLKFSFSVIKYKPYRFIYQHVGFAALILVAANFTSYFIKSVNKGYPIFRIVPGPLFHVFTIYAVGIVTYILVMIIIHIIKATRLQLQRRELVIFGMAVFLMFVHSLFYFGEWIREDWYFSARYGIIPLFVFLAYAALFQKSITVGNIMRRVLIALSATTAFSCIFFLFGLVLETVLNRPLDYRLVYPVFLSSFVIVLMHKTIVEHITIGITKVFFKKRFESEKVSKDLSRHILQILKRDEIFKYILSTAGFLLDTQKLAIFAREELSNNYVIHESVGIDIDELSVLSYNDKSWFFKYLLSVRKGITGEAIISDYRKIKVREEIEPLIQCGFVFYVPFIAKEKILAVLVVGEKKNGTIYTEEDREILAGLVINATMAIENIQLIELNEKLKELDEMKRDFISNVTHELKSPLTAIQSCVEFLIKKRGGDLTRFQMDYLVMVQNNTARLTRFITQVLDVSRIEAARLDLYKEETSLQNLAQEIALLFGPYADEKGIKIRVSSQPDIMEVMADQDKIKQVLTNLISNALKFTDYGEILIRIEDKPDCIEVKISDTGVGIPEEAVSKLFDKFYQVKETHRSKKYDGTGLGLAIVKGIIDAHGGRILVESELGRGTTFVFTLPKYTWE